MLFGLLEKGKEDNKGDPVCSIPITNQYMNLQFHTVDIVVVVVLRDCHTFNDTHE